jgi:hypothetical protein
MMSCTQVLATGHEALALFVGKEIRVDALEQSCMAARTGGVNAMIELMMSILAL